MRYRQSFIPVVLALTLLFTGIRPAFAEPLDFDVPGGHFFTQTNGQDGVDGTGYAVIDDATARFWSEFQRLGGVQVLGYPVSHRFTWDGFVVQAFQKVVFQWRPEAGQAYFVNVFDRLGQAGKDSWLEAARATPASFDHSADKGLAWDDVVKRHIALLDANPAIRAVYLADSDPVQHYGLPMSSKDYGNVFVVRAQRAVFQQWKENVPWARAGQVVVANGGDVAKEAGMFPSEAVQPRASTSTTTAPAPAAAADQWTVHSDGEKSFKVPPKWEGFSRKRGTASHNYYGSPDGKAVIYYLAPFGMGAGYKLEDFLREYGFSNAVLGTQQTVTINGRSANMVWYEIRDSDPVKGVMAMIQQGKLVYFIAGMSVASAWATYEPIFNEVIQSYEPKGN